MIKRREFITLLGGAATACPLAARAQPAAVPVVGLLGSGSPELNGDRVRVFRQGLSDTGYVEGRTVTFEYRWAGDQYDLMPVLAADLVRRQVAVIATLGGVPAVRAAKAVTTTIPIVFVTGTDPVAFGLVGSLNRPGGNVTGVTTLSDEVAPKRLELLHELLPTATVIGLMVNPTNPNSEAQSKDLQAAARALGLQLHVLHASIERDLDAVFASLRPALSSSAPIRSSTARGEANSSARLRYATPIPTVSFNREFAVAGGLMSYGNVGGGLDPYRVAGSYAGRILKGEKPADLPVQQAVKVELIINMKTAKTLGLTFPTALLVRADEVIE
jgi:putative ABC transport system substrate-binding protein